MASLQSSEMPAGGLSEMVGTANPQSYAHNAPEAEFGYYESLITVVIVVNVVFWLIRGTRWYRMRQLRKAEADEVVRMMKK